MDESHLLKEVFEKYDKNHDGSLTCEEFSNFIWKLKDYVDELHNVEKATINSVFKFYDIDSDGKLSLDDICEWWKKPDKYALLTGEKATLINKAHDLYSKYANGPQLTYEEFENLLESLNVAHQETTFDINDVDGNGLMSFNEFFLWLKWV